MWVFYVAIPRGWLSKFIVSMLNISIYKLSGIINNRAEHINLLIVFLCLVESDAVIYLIRRVGTTLDDTIQLNMPLELPTNMFTQPRLSNSMHVPFSNSQSIQVRI